MVYFLPVFIWPTLSELLWTRLITKTRLLRIVVAWVFSGWVPFLSPNQQCQSTEGNILKNLLFIVSVLLSSSRWSLKLWHNCEFKMKNNLVFSLTVIHLDDIAILSSEKFVDMCSLLWVWYSAFVSALRNAASVPRNTVDMKHLVNPDCWRTSENI